jgi:protein arginine kinase activator
MLCDICGKNAATVHLTEIIDNQMNELHLCEECARQKSTEMEQQFGLSDLLAGLAEFEKPVKETETAVSLKCKKCGLSYSDFKKIGRLGCGECYNTFRKQLGVLLKRIHGSNQHVGKAPARASSKRPQKLDLQELRQQLQRAIEQEEFEEAAHLRDTIRELEKKGERDESK